MQQSVIHLLIEEREEDDVKTRRQEEKVDQVGEIEREGKGLLERDVI